MADEFTAKMDTSSIDAFARGFVKKYGEDVTKALVDSGLEMVAHLQDGTRSKLMKGPHTGALLRSWKMGGVYFAGSDEASVDVISDLPYALIHDRGGVIKPTRAKALAIPNHDSAFFRGSNRDFPSPRDLPADKNRLLWLDKDTGTLKDDKGQVAYFLKRSVKMPARYYIRDSVKAALPEILAIFDELVESAIEEGEK